MRKTPKIPIPLARWNPAGGSSLRPDRAFSKASINQPVVAIQPTIGMMRIRPWTAILPSHAGSLKAHPKASPTLFTERSLTGDRQVGQTALAGMDRGVSRITLIDL